MNHHQDPGRDYPGRAHSWKLSPGKATLQVKQRQGAAKEQETVTGVGVGGRRGCLDRKRELAVVGEREGEVTEWGEVPMALWRLCSFSRQPFTESLIHARHCSGPWRGDGYPDKFLLSRGFCSQQV
jgi:hypothetical protein